MARDAERRKRKLLEKWDFRVLRADIEDLKQTVEEQQTGVIEEIDALHDALWEIRDWFDSVLVRKEPMRDPRKILALVERELGL